MGSDPTFTTRADLVAWVEGFLETRRTEPGHPRTRAYLLETLATVRRVTDAHSHLIGSATHG